MVLGLCTLYTHCLAHIEQSDIYNAASCYNHLGHCVAISLDFAVIVEILPFDFYSFPSCFPMERDTPVSDNRMHLKQCVALD